jgi:hypothetical protein
LKMSVITEIVRINSKTFLVLASRNKFKGCIYGSEK